MMNEISIRNFIEAFVEIFYKQKKVRKAFEVFVAEDYIQHNPTIGNGREAAIEMLEPKFSNPEASFDIKRILIDGNMAVIHLNGKLSNNTLGVAVVDIYRIENEKIVEHWDVLQAVPTESANKNTMF
jgi:predicted SnoaL-like aldol condensation-catalyzing enzyme